MSAPDRKLSPGTSHAAGHAAGQNAGQDANGRSASKDDILHVLSEFETGLESLKALYAERQKLQQALKAREETLIERDRMLAEKTRQLEAVTSQFELQVKELDASRNELSTREQEIEQRTKELEATKSKYEEVRKLEQEELAATKYEVERQRKKARKEFEFLERRFKDLQEKAKDVNAQAQVLEKQREEIASQQAKLAEDRQGIDGVRAELEAKQAQIAEAQGRTLQAQRRVEELEAALAQLSGQQKETQSQSENVRERLAQALEELRNVASERDEAQRRLSESSQQVSATVAEFERRVRDAEARAASFQAQAEEAKALRTAQEQESTSRLAAEIERERASARHALDAAQRALHEAADHRDALIKQLAEDGARFAEQHKNLSERLDGVMRRTGELEQALAARTSRVAELEEHAKVREQRAEQLAQSLRQQEEKLAQATRLHEASEEQCAQLREQLREQAQRFEKVQHESLHGLESTKAASRALEEQVRTLEQQLHDQQTHLGEAREQMNARTRELAALRRERDELVAEHARALQESQFALQDARAASEAERRARAGDAEEAKANAQWLAKRIEELESIAKRGGDQAQQVAAILSEREQRIATLTQEHLVAQESVEKLTRELESSRLALEQTREASDALRASERVLREELGERDARIASLSEEVQAALDRSKTLEQDLDQARRELVRLQHTTPTALGDGAPHVTEIMRQRDEKIDELTKELSIAESHVVKLAELIRDRDRKMKEMEQRMSGDGLVVPSGPVLTSGVLKTVDALERRRNRLDRARTLLRERTEKVRIAGEAVAKRFEQAELVFKQRAELASARERIIEGERRIQRAAASSKMGLTLACCMLVVGVLGALSWAAATQFAPATYAASVTIGPANTTREPTAAEQKEWYRFHKEALTDPRFISLAAERYAQIGVESLSSPPDIMKLTETKQLTYEEGKPGEIVLHMTGGGKERTQELLQTFAFALSSFATGSNISRLDGMGTAIQGEVTVTSTPIDNAKLTWAAIIFATGVTVFFGVGLALWKKLASAKTAFERDTYLHAVLEESRWNGLDPTSTQTKHVSGRPRLS